jgi:hypothetical protein
MVRGVPGGAGPRGSRRSELRRRAGERRALIATLGNSLTSRARRSAEGVEPTRIDVERFVQNRSYGERSEVTAARVARTAVPVEAPAQTPRRALRPRPPTCDQAIRIVRAVAEALAFAHDHNVIHANVSPGNVLIRRSDGAAKLSAGVADVIDRALEPDPIPASPSVAEFRAQLLAAHGSPGLVQAGEHEPRAARSHNACDDRSPSQL